MKNGKKWFLGLFSLLFTLILFSCGNDKIEVVIGMWPESTNTQDVGMFNEWKRKFETDYPEYEIIGESFIYTPEVFRIKATSHALPTVYQTWFTEPQMIVDEGAAKDITSITKDLGWYDKMDPSLRDYLTFDDKLYGIPRDGYGLGILINLGLFYDAGLVSDLDGDGVYDIVDPANPEIKYYPQTLDELREFCKIIKQNTGADGLMILNTDKNGGWQFSNYAWNYGAQLQVVDDEGKVHSNLNSPEAVAAMSYLKSLYSYADGESVSPSGSMNYNEWQTRLASNQVAMAICGNDAINNVVQAGGMRRDDIAFIPIPAGPTGLQNTLFGGTPYMFSAYSSDEAVLGAIRFLEYMGRSPELSEVSKAAMQEGMEIAKRKGNLILPEIKPWINADYVAFNDELTDLNINVKSLANFQDFFTKLPLTKHPEETYYTQMMYELLDQVVVNLQNLGYDVQQALNAKNELFENYLRSKLG